MMLPSRSSALLASSSTRKYASPLRIFVVARNNDDGGAPSGRRMSCTSIIGPPCVLGVQYYRNDARQQHSRQLRRHRCHGQRGITMSSPHNYNDANMMMIPWTGYCDEKATTRRWNSSSGNDAANDGIKKIAERRKQDHGHCVEMVRTRDYEGYRKEFAFFFECVLFGCCALACICSSNDGILGTSKRKQLTKLTHHFLSIFCLPCQIPSPHTHSLTQYSSLSAERNMTSVWPFDAPVGSRGVLRAARVQRRNRRHQRFVPPCRRPRCRSRQRRRWGWAVAFQ